MASLFGLGRKKENEAENEVRNDTRNATSGGTGTGSGQFFMTCVAHLLSAMFLPDRVRILFGGISKLCVATWHDGCTVRSATRELSDFRVSQAMVVVVTQLQKRHVI